MYIDIYIFKVHLLAITFPSGQLVQHEVGARLQQVETATMKANIPILSLEKDRAGNCELFLLALTFVKHFIIYNGAL